MITGKKTSYETHRKIFPTKYQLFNEKSSKVKHSYTKSDCSMKSFQKLKYENFFNHPKNRISYESNIERISFHNRTLTSKNRKVSLKSKLMYMSKNPNIKSKKNISI